MSCDGRIDNMGRCTSNECGAADLVIAYRHTVAMDRPNRWQALLSAHEGRFLGQCPGSARVEYEPCDLSDMCRAVDERTALLAWRAAGRPGIPIAWHVFQAAHGGRLHHHKQTSMAAQVPVRRP